MIPLEFSKDTNSKNKPNNFKLEGLLEKKMVGTGTSLKIYELLLLLKSTEVLFTVHTEIWVAG